MSASTSSSPRRLVADGLDQIGETVVVEIALTVGGGVEVDAVDDALEERIFPGDGPHVGSDGFTDLVRQLADDRPDWILNIFRLQWQIKPHQFVICTHKLERLLSRAHLLGDAIQLVIEHVAEALGEDEGEDIVFVLRRVLGPANGAGGVPDPGFEGFRRQVFGHEIEWSAGISKLLHLKGIKESG